MIDWWLALFNGFWLSSFRRRLLNDLALDLLGLLRGLEFVSQDKLRQCDVKIVSRFRVFRTERLGVQPLQLSQRACVLGEILWTNVGRSLESGRRRSAVATQQLPFAIVELRLTALISVAGD
jgi:hypothetical protein